MQLRLVDVPAVDIGIGGIAGRKIDRYLALFTFFAEELDDAIGALGSIERCRSSPLNYFHPLDGGQVQRIKVGSTNLDAIQHDQRHGPSLDGIDTTKHDIHGITRVAADGRDLGPWDLTDQRL